MIALRTPLCGRPQKESMARLGYGFKGGGVTTSSTVALNSSDQTRCRQRWDQLCRRRFAGDACWSRSRCAAAVEALLIPGAWALVHVMPCYPLDPWTPGSWLVLLSQSFIPTQVVPCGHSALLHCISRWALARGRISQREE
jgi:hypothetical protein